MQRVLLEMCAGIANSGSRWTISLALAVLLVAPAPKARADEANPPEPKKLAVDIGESPAVLPVAATLPERDSKPPERLTLDPSPDLPPPAGPDSVDTSGLPKQDADPQPQPKTVPLPDSKTSGRRRPTIEPWPAGGKTASQKPARKVIIERVAPDEAEPKKSGPKTSGPEKIEPEKFAPPANVEDPSPIESRPEELSISADLLPIKPGAPSRSLDDVSPPLDLLTPEASSFKRIQPGVSTLEDVQKHWGAGKPLAKTADAKDGSTRVYAVQPYKHVEVSFAEGHVASIAVQFDKPSDPETLAKQLHLEAIVGVRVNDSAGVPLGESFPERGIIFSFAPGSQQVTEILIEALDAEPFVVRASLNSEGQIRRSLVDLDHAIQLDDQYGQAYLLKAQILNDIGRFDEALESIDAVLKLDAGNPACRLAKAEILGHLSRTADAIEIAQALLANKKITPVMNVRATCLLGDLTADGPDHDYAQAIQHHQSAIDLAQPLTESKDGAIRRQAKRTLLDAHLGAAKDIAYGTWRQKQDVASRWIDRVDELTKDLIRNEHVDRDIGLYAARRTLDAGVGAGAKLDKTNWTIRVLQQSQRLVDAAEDPLRRQKLQWEMGLAMFDSIQLDQPLGAKNRSLRDSMQALATLAQGSAFRQHTTDDDYLFGRLYAHIGAAYAVQKTDHEMATTWFDQALPFLDRPLPPSATANIGRHGETFVSMGISYWEIGRREQGIKITEKGVELMAKAAKAKLLDERSLAIPYGNLAAMHRTLGDDQQATSFADMAARYEAPKRK